MPKVKINPLSQQYTKHSEHADYLLILLSIIISVVCSLNFFSRIKPNIFTDSELIQYTTIVEKIISEYDFKYSDKVSTSLEIVSDIQIDGTDIEFKTGDIITISPNNICINACNKGSLVFKLNGDSTLEPIVNNGIEHTNSFIASFFVFMIIFLSSNITLYVIRSIYFKLKKSNTTNKL